MKKFDLQELRKYLVDLAVMDEVQASVAIHPDTSLSSLPIDSLTAAELMIKLEDAYSIQLSFSVFTENKSVGEFIDYINLKLSSRP